MKPECFDHYAGFLEKRKSLGLHRQLSLQDKQPGIAFDHNDILGLSQHPALIESAVAHAQRYGTSISGSRLICPYQSLYGEVEHSLKLWTQRPAALLFASGFQANVSVIAALLDRQVLKQQAIVFTDKLIHASMQLGCQLSRCHQVRFHHQDLEHLELRLKSYQGDPRPKFILVESLYGMEGSLTDIKALSRLSKEYNAFLYVDEAHAIGVYGPLGAGFCAGVPGVDLVLGTFSKALGSFGGFVSCSEGVKEYLLNRCAGVIYTTALPPMVLGAQKAALDLMPHLEPQRQHLQTLSDLWPSSTQKDSKLHINLISIENPLKAKHIQNALAKQGLFVSLIRPPTTPSPRLRISVNASHSPSDVATLLQALDFELNTRDWIR